MPLEKIGYSFESLKNITTPNLNVSVEPKTFLSNIVSNANEMTNNYFGFGFLGVLALTMYWRMTDNLQNNGFGYSSIRALTLSLLTASLFSLIMIEVELINNFFVVSMFVFATLISSIVLFMQEKKWNKY